MFPYDEEAAVDFDPTHTIRQFIRYIEDMLCQVTLEEKPHPLLQHAAASFYELVSRIQPIGNFLYTYCTVVLFVCR